MKHLYYVVEKETKDFDGVEECTGNRIITVYEMVDNKPNEFATVECTNEDNSEEVIEDYLIDNGYGDTEIKLHIL